MCQTRGFDLIGLQMKLQYKCARACLQWMQASIISREMGTCFLIKKRSSGNCIVIRMHLNDETKVSRENFGDQKAVAEVPLGVLLLKSLLGFWIHLRISRDKPDMTGFD
jgi:hypothetical protein